MEIVKLIGSDVLPDDQKLVLEIARVIRLGFLQQNAFHKDDTCVPLKKQFKMMEIILYLYEKCRALIVHGHAGLRTERRSKIFDTRHLHPDTTFPMTVQTCSTDIRNRSTISITPSWNGNA